jgi:hypothetical protein
VQTPQYPALSSRIIKAVKAAALSAAPAAVRSRHTKLARTTNGFLHPGTYASALELASTQAGVAAQAPLQVMALNALVTGDPLWVPRKPYGSWSFRVDTPAAGYGGPFPSAKVDIDWGARAP